MLPAQPNQSLIDGIVCLQALASRGTPVGVRELSRELGLEATRVHRLLGTLAHLGLIEKTADRKYQPGPGMHVLSAQALKGSRLLQVAWPHLRDLAHLRCTIALGLLWHDAVCYLYHGKPDRPFEEGVFHFDLFAATKSSIGLLLLASAKTPAPRGMRARYKQIQKEGYCFIERPGEDNSLAVPIGSPPVAGLAFAGKFKTSEVPKFLEQLRATTSAIEQQL